MIAGPKSADFTLSKTSITSIAVGQSGAFSISPKTGLSANAYTATVTVSGDNSLAKSFGVSFTVTAAAGSDNTADDDDDETPAGANTPAPLVPTTKPTASGVEATESVKRFVGEAAIEELPESLADIVYVNSDGVVTARPKAVRDGLVPAAKAAVGENAKIVPLPVFEAEVSKSGNAAVIMFEMDMEDFDGLDIDEVAVLKLEPGGDTVLLSKAASAAAINAGQYAWTGADDDPVVGTHAIDADDTYYLYVAIKDDGDMDYERGIPGTIVDPLALAKKQSGVTSDTPAKSSGGCDAGIGALAIAILGLAVARRRR